MHTTDRIRTIVIEDTPIYRVGLVTTFRCSAHIDVVAKMSTSEAESRQPRPDYDVAVIGYPRRRPWGVVELIRSLRGEHPAGEILALCLRTDPACVAELLRAGATGVALVDRPPEEIASAVERTAVGARTLPGGVDESAVDQLLRERAGWGFASMTARESEVFELLVTGARNEDVAAALGVSARTVETHRRNLMTKLGARSIIDLMTAAGTFGPLHS